MVSFDEILQDAIALVRKSARRDGKIEVSPEVALLLEGLGEAPLDEADFTPEARFAEPSILPAATGREAQLEALAREVAACTACGLCRSRKQTVFGVGNPHAELVFVGEAPGAQEDAQGIPFVGDAGQLLTDMIQKGMNIPRGSVYICNVLKCRPPMNRDPSPEEKHLCEPFLVQQLEIIRPRVICALGRHAAQSLLRTEDGIGRLRGRWHDYRGIPVRVTYHPSYLLRAPQEKKKAWEDLQEIMKFLGLPIIERKKPQGEAGAES